jgi:DnaJ-class molecular chaperone
MTEDIHTMGTTEAASLYEVLGCTKEASRSDLKKAYRKLALQLHPDKNLGDELAAAKFQRVSRAYDVLGDPQKRQFYDNNGLTEELDVSAEDWMASFTEMVREFTGGMPIKVCSTSSAVCPVHRTAAGCIEHLCS